jgi:hypothetical protein
LAAQTNRFTTSFSTDPDSAASDLIPLAVHLTVYGVVTENISELQKSLIRIFQKLAETDVVTTVFSSGETPS